MQLFVLKRGGARSMSVGRQSGDTAGMEVVDGLALVELASLKRDVLVRRPQPVDAYP